MCRAVWVLVAGSSEESCKRLRRAAGIEVQVVGMTQSVEEAPSLIDSSTPDVVVIEGSMPGAVALAEDLRARAAGTAVLWVGGDAPGAAHHAVPADADWEEALPGAITKALIARNSAPLS